MVGGRISLDSLREDQFFVTWSKGETRFFPLGVRGGDRIFLHLRCVSRAGVSDSERGGFFFHFVGGEGPELHLQSGTSIFSKVNCGGTS